MLKRNKDLPDASTIDPLLGEVRQLIEQARSSVATAVNAGLTMLNWRIGKRIGEEVLGRQRAEYGNRILAALSQELTAEFGPGFSYSALTRMIRFSEVFPEFEIVATLSQQLGWSHFQAIIPQFVPRTVLDHSTDSPAAGEGWKEKERPIGNVTPQDSERRRVQALAR
jgi:hypothetical protein